jgi:hypothetical protein
MEIHDAEAEPESSFAQYSTGPPCPCCAPSWPQGRQLAILVPFGELDLHHLLIALGFRRDSGDDSIVAQEDHHEVSKTGTTSGRTPTHHRARLGATSGKLVGEQRGVNHHASRHAALPCHSRRTHARANPEMRCANPLGPLGCWYYWLQPRTRDDNSGASSRATWQRLNAFPGRARGWRWTLITRTPPPAIAIRMAP